MAGIPLWQISEIKYADGCREYTVTDKAVMSYPRKKEKKYPGARLLLDPELSPFGGLVEYEIYDMNLFRSSFEEETFTEEEEAYRKLRSERESIRRAKHAVEVIGRANTWDYFFTLTFNPDKVNSYDYDSVADALEKWLDCMKHRYSSMQWLLVLEKHKSGRYHSHALVSGCPDIRLIPAVKKSGKIVYTKTGDIVYNMPLEYDYGFTTVTHVKDSGAAAMYISKYIGKALGEVPAGKKRYWASRGLKRLKDIRTTWLFETVEEYETAVDTIMGIADKIHKSFVEAIKTTFTYVKVFAPRLQTPPARCPT